MMLLPRLPARSPANRHAACTPAPLAGYLQASFPPSRPIPPALQEPWLLEYLALDMPAAMTAAGFLPPRQLENSPRHKTVVAVKPQQ